MQSTLSLGKWTWPHVVYNSYSQLNYPSILPSIPRSFNIKEPVSTRFISANTHFLLALIASFNLQTATPDLHFWLLQTTENLPSRPHSPTLLQASTFTITMKSTYQAYLLLLISATSPAALALPAASSEDAVASHTADGAPVINPGYDVSAAEVADAAIAKKCITFTSDNPNWHYTNSAPWSGSGTFGSTGGKICVPHSDSAGGAMYIGSEANPGPGSTKLECFFPSAGTANCDMSLGDGYSLSVKCDVPGHHSIGGNTNLWKTGKPCVDKSQEGRGICKNDKGYAPNQSDVTPFFQAGINNGNDYCIWVNCKQDYYFPVSADINCHVSGSHGP